MTCPLGRVLAKDRQLGQDGWLENALRPDERDPAVFEVEAALKDRSRDGGFAEAAPLLSQEVEGA